MGERVLLCNVDALNGDEPKRIVVDGYGPLFVVALGDRYFALSDECTHGMASLSEGFVEDELIYCPMHNGAFALATGAAVVLPCMDPVARYDVVREGDELYLTS